MLAGLQQLPYTPLNSIDLVGRILLGLSWYALFFRYEVPRHACTSHDNHEAFVWSIVLRVLYHHDTNSRHVHIGDILAFYLWFNGYIVHAKHFKRSKQIDSTELTYQVVGSPVHYIEVQELLMTLGFVATGGTGGCRYDNLRCHQWRQTWHHDNPKVSV